MIAAMFFITFWVSIIVFLMYWWKKRKARLSAGEYYLNDEIYKKMSWRKKIVGFICVVSFFGFFVALPEMTPEERAAYQARKEQEKIAAEEKRLAQEKSDAEKKAQEEAEEKRLARMTIDKLEDVSTEELHGQVIELINRRPETRDKLISYIFNVQLVNNHFIKQNTVSDISSSSGIMNSIPLIGGYLSDRTYDNIIQKYGDALVAAVTDYSIIRKTAQACVDSGLITERVHDIYLTTELPDENDVEIFNAKMNIAELNRRFFESFVEANKSDQGIQDLLSPLSPVDFVVGAFSAVFFGGKAEYRATIQASSDALQNICETLWIDMHNYDDEDHIAEYYRARIPKYLFAYDIEETYFPQSLDEVYVSTYSGAVPDDALKKLYAMLSGEWKSLKTGETITIKNNYENTKKVMTYPKINMVHMMSKTAPYAECDYRGEKFGAAGTLVEIFLTPARLPDKDGNKQDIILLYANYKPVALKGIHDDRWSNDWDYVQNYRVFNMQSADDIFFKKL